jgi:alpha-galactosidase
VDDEGVLLQVWRRGGDESVELPLPALAGHSVDVEVLYPSTAGGSASWSAAAGALRLHLPDAASARLLRLTVHTSSSRTP